MMALATPARNERGACPVGRHCHGEHGAGQVPPVVDGGQVAATDCGEHRLGNHVGQGRGEQEAANAQGNNQTEGAGQGGEQVISVCVHQHDSVLAFLPARASTFLQGVVQRYPGSLTIVDVPHHRNAARSLTGRSVLGLIIRMMFIIHLSDKYALGRKRGVVFSPGRGKGAGCGRKVVLQQSGDAFW